MNELIKITENNGRRAVSARELHEFLESKQDFSTWIKNRIEKYDLVENVDYIAAPQIYGTANGGHSTRIEYVLSVQYDKLLNQNLKALLSFMDQDVNYQWLKETEKVNRLVNISLR